MDRWFSFSSLAGAPLMPKTRAGVRKKAQREGWTLREATGLGGPRLEASEVDLPAETIAYLDGDSRKGSCNEPAMRVVIEISIRVEGES